MKNWAIKILPGLLILGGFVATQSKTDCVSIVSALEQRLEAQRRLLADWAGLIHYGSENTELPKSKSGEDRVVFLGDEITENWGRGAAKFFPGKPYLNRGIKGQTTPQMLVRFRQDVIKLNPKVVVILAGANDIASFYEPITQGMLAENITSIVELAKANNIRVVLASLTPINDYSTKQSSLRPFGKIIGINNWLKDYAAQSGSVYLDYYSAMAEGRNLKKELTDDGLLPNDAGYAVMAPLAEAAIAQALGRK
ncbi:MAG: SGNH/GDSL hydrolase family protein [Blastocatellia bacterium]